MNTPIMRGLGGLIFSFLMAVGAAAAPIAKITVDAAAKGVPVSPVMHGVFFEDINYGADGGIYAELVQNRSFEHAEALYSWGTVNRAADALLAIGSEAPMNKNNPHYARLAIRDAGKGFGIANYGFGGIVVEAGDNYLFSVRMRVLDGFGGKITAVIEDDVGQNIGQCVVADLSKISATDASVWTKYEGTIKVNSSATHARLVVIATPGVEGTGATGRVDLDVVSLFPEKTWKMRRNGLRADMVQMLADMKPGFVRFPGGCIVEGTDLANAYRWKDTVGDIAERPQNWNRWQHALRKDHAPQYYQTYGLGFFEYFQLCEDIDAAPVPIINCGMACQYQTSELVPLADLDPYVQDALDLIEFANGPVTSKWGKLRADMGHPAPFGLKYLGVGNEQWGEQYFERYKIFYDALKAKHPEIELITTSGPGVDDQWWKLAWEKFRSGTPAEIVDEHYYRPPSWFFDNAGRYDSYDRKGPKVFAGEFAAHERNRGNTLRAALAEAAFMTGLLRNAEVVTMAAYAPLFAKDGATQWAPDLIWGDNTRVYGSPSYHVQKLYSLNRPDVVVPLQLALPPAPVTKFPGRIAVGTWLSQAEFKDIIVTTPEGRELFRGDNDKAWEFSKQGQWEVKDGVVRQSDASVYDIRAAAGDVTWTDYTLSLKARKTGGEEGFQIFVQMEPNGGTARLNLGSRKNTRFALDLAGTTVDSGTGAIEQGRWYDVKIDVRGGVVTCFLDGKPLLKGERKLPASLYAVAGRDNKAGEIILHVVNPAATPQEVDVNLTGTKVKRPKGTEKNAHIVTLTSGSLDDVNTLTVPQKVAPHEETTNLDGPRFKRTLPAYSYTVVRLKTE